MALNANIVWEIRTTGADTNGGGFKTGASGTDHSQQDAAQYAVTDGVTAGTTTITSATANFGTDVVGNLIYVAGGTGSVAADWYEITARTDASTITVDRSTGLTAGTGVTLNIGGALQSPAIPAGKLVSGNDVWIKAGTYTITTSSANIAGGRVSVTTGGVSGQNPTRWEGYQTTRGDKGTKPIISAGAVTAITIFGVSSTFVVVDNITVDGNSGATNTGFVFSASRIIGVRLKAQNCTVRGIYASGGNVILSRCQATGCSGTAAIASDGGNIFWDCESFDNTIHGFVFAAGTALSNQMIRCIADTNTGASTDGFNGSTIITMDGCIAYANGRHGFNCTVAGGALLMNCIAEANTGTGFDADNPYVQGDLINCAVYNNGTDFDTTNWPNRTGSVTGTGSFFTDAAAGDFSLNNTASAGAAARAVGYPGVFARGTTTGYRDIGAAQHADPAGSGGGSLFGGGLVH